MTCDAPFPDNKFLKLNGEAYCSQTCIDSKNATDTCAGCNKTISLALTSLTALDAKWHTECLVCGKCKSPFPDGRFVVCENTPFCNQDCVDASRPCGECGEPIPDGGQYVVLEGTTFHPQCQRATPGVAEETAPGNGAAGVGSAVVREASGSETCCVCAGTLVGTYLLALEKTWHQECLKCVFCASTFPDLSFVHQDGNVYCNQECVEDSLPQIHCGACSARILSTEESIEAIGKRWHMDCFVCAVCSKPFEGLQFIAVGGSPTCSTDCAESLEQ